MPHVQIAIGVITDGKRVLVGRRSAGDRFAGLHEFPGGKLLDQESAADCVRREILEEVGVEVELRARLAPITHSYPELQVCLHPFIVSIARGSPRPLATGEVLWVELDTLPTLPFPEANAQLIAALPMLIRSLSPEGGCT